MIKGQTYVLWQRKLEEVWGMCLTHKSPYRVGEPESYGLLEVLLYHLEISVGISPPAKRSGERIVIQLVFDTVMNQCRYLKCWLPLDAPTHLDLSF